MYDIADLYKAEIAIPIAFDVAKEEFADIGAITRRRMRDRMHEFGLAERCVRDVRSLLLDDSPAEDRSVDADVVVLWDGENRVMPGGINYEVDW